MLDVEREGVPAQGSSSAASGSESATTPSFRERTRAWGAHTTRFSAHGMCSSNAPARSQSGSLHSGTCEERLPAVTNLVPVSDVHPSRPSRRTGQTPMPRTNPVESAVPSRLDPSLPASSPGLRSLGRCQNPRIHRTRADTVESAVRALDQTPDRPPFDAPRPRRPSTPYCPENTRTSDAKRTDEHARPTHPHHVR
jgi:hypothetical protein